MVARHRVIAALWIALYVVIAIAPLFLTLIDIKPERGFWVNFSIALGFVGLSILGLQFALAARLHMVSDSAGMDSVLLFHRQVTFVAVLVVFAHPLILFIYNTSSLVLLNVFTSPLRAKFAVLSVVALVVLIVTSLWRQRLRLSYQTWQFLHAILALTVVTAAMVHVVLVGYYLEQPAHAALWLLLTVLFVGLGLWVRVIKPLVRRRRRWVVDSVTPEPGGATTIQLRPADPTTHGAKGFAFAPGQFAWVTARRSPFSLTFHPFSFSSSAENTDSVSFTIRAVGDFTSEVEDLQPGESVYLDGPHGSFNLDRYPGSGLVLIGAGVGVTPLISMLATLADRGDQRPCTLLLANSDESSITCGALIENVQSRLNLRVIHILSRPSPDWTGATGRVTPENLFDYLPEDQPGFQYFICGAPALLDIAEKGLLAARVPASRIHSERFGMV